MSGRQDGGEPRRSTVELVEASREREKRQALFYRRLAAEAGTVGDDEAVERLNELHADEQHHLSRLTARLLEMGGRPRDLRDLRPPEATLEGWTRVARDREDEEIRWYEAALEEEGMDGDLRRIVEEILESERHHRAELRGKWMSA